QEDLSLEISNKFNLSVPHLEDIPTVDEYLHRDIKSTNEEGLEGLTNFESPSHLDDSHMEDEKLKTSSISTKELNSEVLKVTSSPTQPLVVAKKSPKLSPKWKSTPSYRGAFSKADVGGNKPSFRWPLEREEHERSSKKEVMEVHQRSMS
ncbi:hypothetical protein KI387_009099, partial [Taxus chinensis]